VLPHHESAMCCSIFLVCPYKFWTTSSASILSLHSASYCSFQRSICGLSDNFLTLLLYKTIRLRGSQMHSEPSTRTSCCVNPAR
jgi:hypothetical protein